MPIPVLILLFALAPIYAETQATPTPPAAVLHVPRRPATEVTVGMPWETAVRLRIKHGDGRTTEGSGVIIHSTEEETIVLTAAHLLGKNPDKTYVDLFDREMIRMEKGPGRVTYRKTVWGTFFELDRLSDLALVRTHPREVLPVSRFPGLGYRPLTGAMLMAVGCSDGGDATIWNTRYRAYILREMRIGDQVMPEYTGYECEHAPKLGRSGGGLFTENGNLIGVCNFAIRTNSERVGASPEVGIYASLGSIRRFLRGTDYAYLTETGNH